MTDSVAASSAEAIPVIAVNPNKALGQVAARRILSEWKPLNEVAANTAAYQLGELVSRLLPYHLAKDTLERGFVVRLPNEEHRQTARDFFNMGQASSVNSAELIKRHATPANDNNRFHVTWFDDVNQTAPKEEIVEGLIGAGEFSLWVAKPGTAKSVLLADIGCHIARGLDWHGRRVKQGLVVFFAAERKKLTERRIAAWRKKHGASTIPFAVIGGKLDLTTGLVDAKALAATIRALEENSGHACVLVILDTVTRTFGIGDQNSSKDMGRFVQSVDELTRATGAHVAAIHHSGWAGDRGKGAIDLDGACDVSYGVSVVGSGLSKLFTLECTGANDGDEGVITSFRLESVVLSTDEDGNATDAPVVVQADAAKYDGSKLKGSTAKALDSLRAAVREHGKTPPEGSPGFPDGVDTVSRDQWREQFYGDMRAKEPSIKGSTLRQRFNRAVDELVMTNQVETVGERCWVV